MVGVIAIYLVILHVCCVSTVDADLTCPEGVKSFSHEVEGSSYYVCEEDKKQPVLKTCPPGTYYWAYKKSCHDVVMENAVKTDHRTDLDVYAKPALGNHVSLGDLYNANTDQIITGYTFWNRNTILRNKWARISPSVSIDIFATRSAIDRLQMTGYSSATKLDIIGDLVRVKGSSAYLKDALHSENEVAIILSYQVTTHVETFPVLTPKDVELCGENGFTHVITSATYGIGANFVFKKTVKEGESVDKLTEDLQFAVNAIKTTKGEISDVVKKIVEDVRVNFFADFVAEKEPGNYEESLQMYQSLSSRIGKFPTNANNTVIMEVDLMPITSFCKGKIIKHIVVSDDILSSVSKMFGAMDKTKLIIKTLKMEKVVRSYLPLKKILQTLLDELTIFELHMKTDLRIILPRIHRGNSSEEELVLLLNKYTASPFYYDNVETFLGNRRRELNMLHFIVNPAKLEGTDISVINYMQASDIKIMFIKPFVLMLRYNILPSKQIIRMFLNGDKIDESKSWFNNPYVISAMGIQFNNFVQFASSNKNSKTKGYLLAIADAKDEVINVNAQKEGLLYTFTFPGVPPAMASISTTYNSITFIVKRPSSTWVTAFCVSYRQYGSQVDHTSKPYEFSKRNATTVKIDALIVNTVYQFSLQYLTPMGASPPSPISHFSTRPCSVPTNLRASMVAADSFKIYWDPPLSCGKGVHIGKYKVTVTGDNDFFRAIIVDGATNVEVKRVHAASKYNVSIQAIADKQTFNKTERPVVLISLPSSTLNIITRPDAPSHLSLVNRSINSVVVSWTPTAKVAVGAILQMYKLKYAVTDNIGNVSERGTEMVVSSLNTSYRITDLVQGTMYSVSVKVMTSKGDSDYSPSLIIKTMFQKSELDVIRESLNNSVAVIESEIMKRKEEVDDRFDTADDRFDNNDATIKTLSNIPSLMVYYPRLRSEEHLVDSATGCGGIINTAGGLTYPPNHGYYYRNREDCTWNIRTGLPTTLTSGYWSIFCSDDYVSVYDEEVLLKKSCSSFGTVHIRSGNAYVRFHSNTHGVGAHGFHITISVTDTKRMAAQWYYPKYKATFTGYGSPKSSSEHHMWQLPKSNSSIPLCIQDCNGRYMNDATWNRLSMELDTDPIQCTCYKDAVGFAYSLSKFQYRIL